MNGGEDDAPVVPGLRPRMRIVQRIYTRTEPVAVMTLLRAAWRVDRALHFLDRIRDALGIEEDDEFSHLIQFDEARGDDEHQRE